MKDNEIALNPNELVQFIKKPPADFTKGEADMLRKAMGKKIKSLMLAQKEKLNGIRGLIMVIKGQAML